MKNIINQSSSYQLLSLDDRLAGLDSQHAHHRLYWTSSRPPAQIAGALVENYQGAWLEGNVVHVRIGSAQFCYDLPSDAHTDSQSLMQVVLIRTLNGEAPYVIQRDLDATAMEALAA